MLHFDCSLFDLDRGGLVTVIYGNIEGGATYRDHGRRRHYAVRIWNRAKMLNVHPYFPEEYIDQVSPVAGILTENKSRVGINLDCASI